MIDLKETAKNVFFRTLDAIQPDSIIKQKLRLEGAILVVGDERIALDRFAEVVLVGMGKASLRMGSAVEEMLGDRVKRGILVTDRLSRIPVRSEVIVGGHPLPDTNSLIAGERIVELLESCGQEALIVFLISGGGSALVELAVSQSISLEDLRNTNQVLISCGATIHEINLIRKSLSRIKGGGLGRIVRNSRCVGLYISDVNPGDLLSIASNPLLPEKPDQQSAMDVVSRYDLFERLPGSVVDVLLRGNPDHLIDDCAGAGRPLPMLLLENLDALRVAAEEARQLGFRVEVRDDLIEGDYQVIADKLLAALLNLRSSFPGEPVCVVSGGEVSCPVRQAGIGGRNQEFVLYSATRLAGLGIHEGAAVLSCGTDGIDGNSTAAGAVADGELVINAARHAIDASIFISGNDSNTFFKKAGGLVVTGPSGNNVRDLRILMAH